VSTAAPSTSERDQADLRAAIAETFGERAPLARAYADLLVTDGIERGVLGPSEASRVWARHIFNSTALAGLIPAGVRVVDLGSGAGLPGIPLALARPDLTMVLLEPQQRRAAFLRDCLELLGLPGVEVVLGRAESGISPLADCVVARAVAPLDRLIDAASELLVEGGVLLALKGASVSHELEQVKPEIAAAAQILTVPSFGGEATVVRVTRPPRRQPSPGQRVANGKSAMKKSRRTMNGSR
jgi:16S rRNA (guanine527-N7)-methyltransferase